MDKDRSYYFNYYTDQSWDEMNTYDFSIDTSAFTTEEIVDLLAMVFQKL
jgi:cytidylate kinase